jgi:hypothetical protein
LILAVAVLAGCGGSGGDSVSPATGNLNFDGAATLTALLTGDRVIPATGGVSAATTEGQVLIPSGSVDAGTNLPEGTAVAIIPAGVGFDGAFNLGASLTVNGVSNSGAAVASNGHLTLPIGLPVPAGVEGINHTISFPSGHLDTRDLTVQRFVISGKYYLRGGPTRIISPLPVSLSGRIPNNGQSAVNSDVTAMFGPENNGRSATLTIDYGTGFTLSQTKVIANNQVRFANFNGDSQPIPSTGVAEVRLNVGDLP